MPEAITTDDAQYALDLVKKSAPEVGPGLPGTSQERQRAECNQERVGGLPGYW